LPPNPNAQRIRLIREAARPATKLENAIIAAAKEAGLDHGKFAAELDQAGIAIVKVTTADIAALQALRRDQELAAATGEIQARTVFADVKEGEIRAACRGSITRPANSRAKPRQT
jgi:hypothetical protein